MKKPAKKLAAKSRPSKAKAAPKKVAAKQARQRKAVAPKQAKAVDWVKFVERHGIVLASAKGPVPSVAEAIVGAPLVGSWWSHPKGQQIFDALSDIDDHEDIRCFKLVDRKITFVHRRLWPALARLARAGILDAARVAAIQQEHMPSGEHRNITKPFPAWVPDDVLASADALSVADARSQLGSWV